MSWYLGFDPGRDKCGVALVAAAQVSSLPLSLNRVSESAVLTTEAIATELVLLLARHGATQGTVILGNQTLSQSWQTQLKALLPTWQIVTVDERYSSQEARQRFWQYYPAQGLGRLMPLGLRVPPRAVDDVVAIILIERWIANRE